MAWAHHLPVHLPQRTQKQGEGSKGGPEGKKTFLLVSDTLIEQAISNKHPMQVDEEIAV